MDLCLKTRGCFALNLLINNQKLVSLETQASPLVAQSRPFDDDGLAHPRLEPSALPSHREVAGPWKQTEFSCR